MSTTLPSAPVAASRGALLIVDDDRGIREMLAYELALEGFDVDTAESGRAALRALQRRKFDLAVTDMNMPGMDGVATVEALRAADPYLAVIVVTGYASVESAVACMKRGAYDYIQKPFEVAELARLLDRALQKSHLEAVVALYEASRALLATVDRCELVALMTTLAKRLLHGDDCAVLLQRDDGCDVHRTSERALASDELLIELGAACAASGKPLRIPSPDAPVLASTSADATAALLCPVAARGRQLGTLVILRGAASGPFLLSELKRGVVFADQLGLALDNARLHEDLAAKLAELRSARDRLVQTEKIALAGRLASCVAHEINNPLSVVQMNLEALRRYAAKVDDLVGRGASEELLARDVQQVIGDAFEGMRRIADLVADFADLAAASAAVPEPIDVPALFRECAEVRQPSRPGLSRAVVIEEHAPPRAFMPRQDLSTALTGVLTFLGAPRGKPDEPGEPLEVRIEGRAGRACVTIRDAALTLREDERRSLFDPRLEVRESGGARSTRLEMALTLSYQLLARSGAQLSLEPAEGEGVTFQLLLPAEPGSA